MAGAIDGPGGCPAGAYACICMPVLFSWAIHISDGPAQDSVLSSLVVAACAMVSPVILLASTSARASQIDRLRRHAAEALAAQELLTAQIAPATTALKDPDEQAVQRL